MIGQERLRRFLRRVIDASKATRRPLDHMLLIGPSGTGKTTVGTVVANELGTACYQVEAPVSHDTLLALREIMRDGDCMYVDEAHLQAIQERRGRSSSTQPEQFLSILEDRTIITSTGVLDFPAITVIAATTDEGMLPTPFLNRFPLRPQIDRYTRTDLAVMALDNARALSCAMTDEAAVAFAAACQDIPRNLNNLVKNASSLTATGLIDEALADEVLDLNRLTTDGLTAQQATMLTFLYTRCRRVRNDGEVRFVGSAGTLAAATGRGRDVKSVYRDESLLIQRGLLALSSSGRILTEDGIARAKELLGGVT